MPKPLPSAVISEHNVRSRAPLALGRTAGMKIDGVKGVSVIAVGVPPTFAAWAVVPQANIPSRKSTPRNGRLAELLQVTPVPGAAGANYQPTAGGHCVDGVSDQVGKDLAQFSGKTIDIDRGIVLPLNGDTQVAQPSLVQA